MPKKKRTRKDKIQADIKRQSPSKLAHPNKPSVSISRETTEVNKVEETAIGTFSLPKGYQKPSQKPVSIQTPQDVTISTNAYSYLRGDLLKTLFITTVIIAVELLIYFNLMK